MVGDLSGGEERVDSLNRDWHPHPDGEETICVGACGEGCQEPRGRTPSSAEPHLAGNLECCVLLNLLKSSPDIKSRVEESRSVVRQERIQ